MRKISTFLLVLLLLFLTACAPQEISSDNTSGIELQQNEMVSPVEKVKFALEGTVEKSTDFSGGYAIVKTKEEYTQNYIINKDGGVVAVIPDIVFNNQTTHGAKVSEFHNGFTLISDSFSKVFSTICDIEGNLYTADEFSVTAFHPDALKDGYILTSTAAEDGKITKIGVLGLDMNWVIQPNSELAQTIGITSVNGAKNFAKFYNNYIIYGESSSFDVRNGDILSKTYEIHGRNEESQLSEYWELDNGSYYYSTPEKQILKANLYKIGGLGYGYCTLEVDGAKFNGGKAPVLFGDHETQDKFSLIDESGNLVFEPVIFGANVESVLLSGKYILVLGEDALKTYDLSGKAVGTYKNSEISNFSDISFCDEVVILKKSELTADGPQNTLYFYNVEFKPLF